MDIPGVLYRFADKTITEQESADFAAYLQTLSPAEFSDIMDAYGRIVTSSAYTGIPDQSLLALVEQRIDGIERLSGNLPGRGDQPETGPAAGSSGIIRKIYWTVSIAAACLLLAAGVYLYTRPKGSFTKPVAVSRILRIAPGGNKALLTLADGRTITLDSAQNGALATQGSATIVKLQNGELAYNHAKEDNAGPVFYNTITTPKGGQYSIVLPDGSTAWLNAASSLRFPASFKGPVREVELTGEGYFDIAQNPDQPFVVETRGEKIQVLGTRFNIMAYDDEEAVRTTLVGGSVKVISGNKYKVIKPNEQAVLSRDQSQLNVIQANLQEVLAWKEGSFRFYNTPLTAIMRQIARWYDVDIIYEGAPPPDDFYCVISRQQYASQMLDILEQTNNVHFRIDGRKITVIAGPGK